MDDRLGERGSSPLRAPRRTARSARARSSAAFSTSVVRRSSASPSALFVDSSSAANCSAESGLPWRIGNVCTPPCTARMPKPRVFAVDSRPVRTSLFFASRSRASFCVARRPRRAARCSGSPCVRRSMSASIAATSVPPDAGGHDERLRRLGVIEVVDVDDVRRRLAALREALGEADDVVLDHHLRLSGDEDVEARLARGEAEGQRAPRDRCRRARRARRSPPASRGGSPDRCAGRRARPGCGTARGPSPVPGARLASSHARTGPADRRRRVGESALRCGRRSCACLASALTSRVRGAPPRAARSGERRVLGAPASAAGSFAAWRSAVLGLRRRLASTAGPSPPLPSLRSGRRRGPTSARRAVRRADATSPERDWLHARRIPT